MYTKLSKILSAAVLCATSVSMATAASIAVPNFSFEAPAITNQDGFESVAQDWVQTFGFTGNTGIQLGTVTTPDFTGFIGSQVAFANSGSSLGTSADLHTIALGDTYTLTVAAAGRTDFASTGFRIQLTNSAFTPLFTSFITNPADDYAFNDYTISYTIAAGDPFIGQGLRINLINENESNQTSFDNIRLTVDNIPEPSTSLVLISGLALLGLRRRRA
mgnify:CR=1 FL=1